MDPFFVWLEATGFSTWMRESPSMFAFPAILTAHTMGMGFVAGINAAIALRILGVGAGIPVTEMRRFLPVMWLMFWVNAVSGVALLIAYPTKALTNPDFYLKLMLIAAGLVLMKQVERRLLNATTPPDEARVRQARGLAVASLICWGGVITAGRFLAYTHHRLLASF
jgi:hypothetical protein